MSYFDSQYKKGFFERPSDDVDPNIKQNDVRWSKQFVEFIYANYCRGTSAITSDDIARFSINLSYARGRQNTDIYKDLILDTLKGSETGPEYQSGGDQYNPPKTKSAREGFANINFNETMSPMPKYINTIIGIMEGQEHQIMIAAIDERSNDMKENIKYRRYVEGLLRDQIVEFDKAMEIESPPDENIIYPKSVDELGVFEQMGEFRLAYEIGLQRALEHTMKLSNDKKLKRAIVKDILTYGITSTMDLYDSISGEVKTMHLDINNLIIENSKEEDFSDASYWGYIDYVTISQLKTETGLSDDDLFNIANKYIGQFGNRAQYDRKIDGLGFYDFYQCKTPRLVCYFLSNDSKYYTTRKTLSGDVAEFSEPYRKRANGSGRLPRVYDNEEKKTTKETIQSLYSAKWIIGTDIIYDFGRAHDVAFDYAGRKPIPPIQVYKIDEKPIIENCIQMLDQIALTFYRLQNGIAVSPPPGLSIEYHSLHGMTMEDDEEWKPLDSLRLYSQKGHIIWNASPDGVEFPPSGHRPIEQLKGGLGTVVEDAARSFELAYQQLMEITGIDRLSAVSQSPNYEQGKFVTQVAVAATNNTLRSVYAGYISMKEQIAKSVTLRIQALVVTNDETPYNKIIGDSAVSALKSAGSLPPVAFGIHMIATPDEALKQEVRAAAMNALAGGKNGIPALKYSEYLYLIEQLINTLSGISYARVYIAMKEAEADQRAREDANNAQKLASDEVIRQNEGKAKADMDKIAAETSKEKEIISAQMLADLEVLKMTHLYKLEEIEKQKEGKEQEQEQESNLVNK